jgi:flavin-dependent dehydrogenase
VRSYSNYQLLSNQGYGKGWVLIGDAFGFVDPMLSPGIHMSIESAALLEKHVLGKTHATEQDFDRYCAEFKRWHHAWSHLIKFFYDGRILSMGEVRASIQNNSSLFSIPKLVEPYISRVLSSLVSGVKTRSKLNQQILFHSSRLVAGDPNKISAHRVHPSLDDCQLEKDITNKMKESA